MASFFQDFFGKLFGDPAGEQSEYRLLTVLKGHSEPVNSLCFNQAGTLLASGGDDQEVRIWDLTNSSHFQTLADTEGCWGQITTLKFVKLGPEASTDWLCLGTGRGRFVIYRRARSSATFVELLRFRPFSSSDSVESFAFDPFYRRIAMSSHDGRVKVCRVEGNGQEITLLWDDQYHDAIVRSVCFTNRGGSLLVFTMEGGLVHCRDPETSERSHCKTLRTSIGNVDVHTQSQNTVVDNMDNGFDLYPAGRDTPSKTFFVKVARRFVKDVFFAEDGKIVVSGSDHGRVYIFGTSSSHHLQALRHGGKDELVQAIAVTSTHQRHLIASASSTGPTYNIFLWKKLIHPGRRSKLEGDPRVSEVQLFFNFLLVCLLVFITRGTWLPPLEHSYSRTKEYFTCEGSTQMQKLQGMIWPQQVTPATATTFSDLDTTEKVTVDWSRIAEVIHMLDDDDDTVRKIFGMSPKLAVEEILRERGQIKPSISKLEGLLSSDI